MSNDVSREMILESVLKNAQCQLDDCIKAAVNVANDYGYDITISGSLTVLALTTVDAMGTQALIDKTLKEEKPCK